MKISGGLIENGIVVGNAYDKYGSSNPIERWLVRGFGFAMTELVDKVKPASIHEVGCGEGYWTLQWLEQGIAARGSDFSSKVIELAQVNARSRNLPAELFKACSIYDLNPKVDTAELIVCSEVLEHLERPDDGLLALQAIARPYLIISVPREPLWRAMNVVRFKYWKNWGNTPEHIQNWPQREFVALVSCYFEVLEVRSPIPWTMLLCRHR
jgi:2-polyprenyl-3-methyl-5-hydroxy-6-metoxy-1,4-benzoquinol methylase